MQSHMKASVALRVFNPHRPRQTRIVFSVLCVVNRPYGNGSVNEIAMFSTGLLGFFCPGCKRVQVP